jgi:hypothetical protein
MKTFLVKNKLFTVCILLFCLHYCLQNYLQIHFIWADYYLDPILMLPIVLTLYAYEKTILQKPNIGLKTSEIVIITAVIAFVAEFFFPKINSACLGDFWDILGYSAGSTIYILTENTILK